MTDGLVAGRFRLRGLLGSGGTAAVFAADDALTGDAVALKILHPHLAAQRDVWDAFFEEVRAARSVSHPGLVEVRDAGIVDADPSVVWIAMELVDGLSLDEQVRIGGPLGIAAAVIVCDAVLAALEAAHAGGIVHRDVSPSNIMLDPRLLTEPLDADRLAASVRLLDFGLADIPGRTTVGGDALLSDADFRDADAAGVVANASYASPEQVSGAAIDERSDLYQVGACLHFALTGRAPYAGSVPAIVQAHLTAPPPVPSALRRGIPRALDRVVAASMLKRRQERYADAPAMRTALGKALGAVDATAPPSAPALEPRTGVTKVYRTTRPSSASAAVLAPVRPHSTADAVAPPRSGGIAWVVVGVAIVALTAIAGVSAMGASSGAAPEPSPTAPPSSSPATPPTTPPPTRPAPAPVVIPELTGQSLAEARELLARVGLALGDIATEDAAAVADTVLGSSPAAGEPTAAGSAVSVRVASGRNVVPAVAGLGFAEAAALLAAAGFASSTGGDAASAAAVTGTDPMAGSTASVGSVVNLTLAAPSPSPSSSATPTPPPTPAPTGAP